MSVGVSVLAGQEDEYKWTCGIGYSNIEQLTKCEPTAVMRIASISKPITAAVCMQLVQVRY